MRSAQLDPVTIGWAELVDLPDWGVKKLRAKVDTGARTSALHVDNIEELPRGYVRFDVVLHRAKRDRRVHITTKITRRGRVRSSTGHQTTRLFVETTLQLGPIQKRIEVSLVDREKMIHRMLLGRKALSGPILIDVDRRMALKAKKAKKPKASTTKPKASTTKPTASTDKKVKRRPAKK